jgi:multisubunit Na+/H+ antiporter MnhB subunit
MICSNRFEPAAAPSTCTLDTVLIPLPSFLLIAVLLTTLLFYLARGRKNAAKQRQGIHWQTPRWMSVVYILLVIAALALNILQIVRLVLDQQGVGLLPVTLVGIILALAIYRFPFRPYVSYNNLCCII